MNEREELVFRGPWTWEVDTNDAHGTRGPKPEGPGINEMKPAPDGQPTESIRSYLEHARERRVEWADTVKQLEERLASARSMADGYTKEVALYMYQIKLREGAGCE